MSDFDLSRLGEIPDPFAPEPTAVGPLRGAARALDAGGDLPPSPVRGRVRSMRVAAVVAALLWETGWVAFVERRGDCASLAAGTLAAGLALPLVAAVLALSAATQRGPRGLGRSAAEILALTLIPPAVFALITWWAGAPDTSGAPFWSQAVPCMRATTILAAVPLGLGVWSLRGAFASASVRRTAALGVACGALAAATMSLACPDGGAKHVIVAHGVAMVVAGLAGAFLGRKITRS
jgi:hypothetical protein